MKWREPLILSINIFKIEETNEFNCLNIENALPTISVWRGTNSNYKCFKYLCVFVFGMYILWGLIYRQHTTATKWKTKLIGSHLFWICLPAQRPCYHHDLQNGIACFCSLSFLLFVPMTINVHVFKLNFKWHSGSVMDKTAGN